MTAPPTLMDPIEWAKRLAIDSGSYFYNGTINHLPHTRYFLYAINPLDTMFTDVHQVPDYFVQAYVLAILFVQIEELLLFLMGKDPGRHHDRFANYIIMSITMMVKVSIHGSCMSLYLWIYENYRLTTLPINLGTWFLGFLWVDFAYYWLHRARHQVNILWADHQSHHSSEDFHLNISFRVSPIEFAFLYTYLVVTNAVIIPPGIAFVHIQIFYLYQYTLHTEVIPYIRSLEWVLNTPSAHRVHHGRNRRCIDKNFGATLIIWDRLFGTYEPEETPPTIHDPPVYGLVTPIRSFEPMYLLFHHYAAMGRRFVSIPGTANKLKVLCYGPGWYPGSKPLGNLNDVPELKPGLIPPKYDVPISLWFTLYTRAFMIIHLTAFYYAIHDSRLSLWLVAFVMLISMADGILYSVCLHHQFWAPAICVVRCAMMPIVYHYIHLKSGYVQDLFAHNWWMKYMLYGMHLFFAANFAIFLGMMINRLVKIGKKQFSVLPFKFNASEEHRHHQHLHLVHDPRYQYFHPQQQVLQT